MSTSKLKFGSAAFNDAISHPLQCYIMAQIDEALKEEMEATYNRVIKRIAKDLPDNIQARIESMYSMMDFEDKVRVTVDLRMKGE